MAEPLQTLFSSVRARRRPIQFEPFEGFSGPNPGMRGTMPANALDTQSATDMAQGIDISTVAPPTRLQASQIMPALYQQPAGDEEEGDEDPGPQGVRATPASFPMDNMFFPQSQPMCTGPNCQANAQPGMMMAPMQATTLPPGVTLGPGETYVEGSLREGPPSAAMATVAPQQLQSGSAPQKPVNRFDPAYQLERAERAWAQAESAAQGQQAALAMTYKSQAKEATAIGLAALASRQREEMMALTKTLTERGMAQQDRRLALAEREHKAKTGELSTEIEQSIRQDRVHSVAARAEAIALLRYKSINGEDMKVPDAAYKAWVERESGIITASDMSHHLLGYLQKSDAIDQAKANAASPESLALLSQERLRIDARIRTLMRDRFKDTPIPELAGRMENELLPVYEKTFRDWFSRGDQKVDEGVVQAKALQALDIHVRKMVDMMSSGGDPMSAYREAVLGRPAPRPSLPPAPQEYPVSDPVQSSGTTPDGGVLLSNPGTMSLAR